MSPYRLLHVGCTLVLLLVAGCPASSEQTTGDSGGDTSESADGRSDTSHADGSPGDTAPGDASPNDVRDGDARDAGNLIVSPAAIQNPSNALSFYLEWSTTAPATTRAVVRCGEQDEWEETYESKEFRSEHRIFVMGLWDGAECRAELESTTESDRTGEATLTFRGGPIPEALPDFEVSRREAERIQPGWTLMNLWNSYDNVPLTAALVDSRGRLRWYHTLSTSTSGSDTVTRIFEDAVLVGGNRGHVGPRLIDWNGEIVWKDDFRMHHEILPTEDGEHLLYLTNEFQCSLENKGGTVVEYEWREQRELNRWPFCQFWMPPDPGPDWSHLNTIEPFPDENALLLSSRTQHKLFKIDLETEELVWTMGVEGDLALEGEDRFFRQHAPEIQPNGNILLFDNGSLPEGTYSRPWSRALELTYDPEQQTVEPVWSYRPEPDLFAPIWGDADRLENGNTLVTFGLRNRDEERNSRIEEVTAEKEVVWRLNAPNKWGWYRSERIANLPVGGVVSDSPEESLSGD